MTKSTKYFDTLPRQTYDRLYKNNYPIPVAGNTKLTFTKLRVKERVSERQTFHFYRDNHLLYDGALIWIFVACDQWAVQYLINWQSLNQSITFPPLYTARRYITVLTTVRHCTLSEATSTQCKPFIITSNLSNDRSKASCKTVPPHSAI